MWDRTGKYQKQSDIKFYKELKTIRLWLRSWDMTKYCKKENRSSCRHLSIKRRGAHYESWLLRGSHENKRLRLALGSSYRQQFAGRFLGNSKQLLSRGLSTLCSWALSCGLSAYWCRYQWTSQKNRERHLRSDFRGRLKTLSSWCTKH